ncbi:MAG: phospholipid/cholesterol/gamma-HCH transport system substrate-binding protein [Thermoleophilaceae bacterium]|jgi:virulence factor Mce-like protein|nr:phospholipid/cholesterol/gamma-HCH transport system substrate-binding protein [Thermoleophilaceae bacterium]
MIKQAPSVGRILTMVAFSLSCFGIVLFLWLSFGGSVPLRPEGYRANIAFPEATQLAQGAEVRISGVKVGRVRAVEPNEQTGLTDTVVEIDSRYAPIPKDTRAILRQKTLLGETYVELSPGSAGKGPNGRLADGGDLPQGQVAETVELDEILRTFDPETRRQFSVWLDQQGLAVGDNAEAINDALASLTPFAEQTDEVLKVLNHQSAETRSLVRDTGEVFDALTERQGQLRDLIVNSNRVWEVTARRDAELADTFRVLPTFLREGRTTTRRLTAFAKDTNPLIDQLRPAARQLSPALVDLDKVAPDLRGFFKDLDPLVRVSRRGLPATTRALNNTRPLLRRVSPFLRQFTPIVDYLGLYRREIAAFFANDSAVTQATGAAQSTSTRLHYLRTQNPTNPEIMAGYPSRLATNRSNPYIAPGGYEKLRTEGHLEVFNANSCGTTPVPSEPAPLDPWLPANLVALVGYFTFGGTQNRNAAPPCDPQAPLGQILGQSGDYPHLEPLP